MGYSPQDRTRLDTTKATNTRTNDHRPYASVALRHRDCDVNKFIQENKLSPEDLGHQTDDEAPEKTGPKLVHKTDEENH